MKLFSKSILGIIFTLSIFVGATVAEKDARTRKSYPLPIAELKHLTTNWLYQAGYDFADRELETGIIQFTCSHVDQNWTIILRPQSALATEVIVYNAEDKTDATGFEAELSAYIDDYLHPDMDDAEKSAHDSNIPAAVFFKADAVVCIQAEFNRSIIQFSGFILDSKGTIICTTHDLRKFRKIKITDNRGQAYKGELIKFDTRIDLALIQTTIKPRAYISFSNGKHTLLKGSPLYSIGCPVNRGNTITVGTVNKPPVRANQLVYWKVDMEILPGSSGSPVFNSQGELVGMIKGRYRGDSSIGFLIPADRIINFINES